MFTSVFSRSAVPTAGGLKICDLEDCSILRASVYDSEHAVGVADSALLVRHNTVPGAGLRGRRFTSRQAVWRPNVAARDDAIHGLPFAIEVRIAMKLLLELLRSGDTGIDRRA